MALAIFTLHVAKNQAMLWSIEYYITLLLLFIIAFKCILNMHWLIALVQKVLNFEIRSFFHFPTPKHPYSRTVLLLRRLIIKNILQYMYKKKWKIFFTKMLVETILLYLLVKNWPIIRVSVSPWRFVKILCPYKKSRYKASFS